MEFYQHVRALADMNDHDFLDSIRDTLVLLSARERDVISTKLYGAPGSIPGGGSATAQQFEERAGFVSNLIHQIETRDLSEKVQELTHPYTSLPLGWDLKTRTIQGRSEWTWAEACQIAWRVNRGCPYGEPVIEYPELGQLVFDVIEREAPGIEPDQTVGAEQMATSILFAKLSDGTIDIRDLACNVSFLTPAMTARHIEQECHWVALEGFGYSSSYESETHYTETFYGFDYMITERF